MGRVDQYGRHLSDDGRFYWDGTAWQACVPPGPVPAPPPQLPQPPQVSHLSPDARWAWTDQGWIPADSLPPGRYFDESRTQEWAGTHWIPVQAPPGSMPGRTPVPAPVSAPVSAPGPAAPSQHHAAPMSPGGAPPFDPVAEAKRYPTMWRLVGRALRDVPPLLEPGETVLATAPGEGGTPHLLGLAIVTGYRFDPGYLLVATDRRLLALGLTLTAGNVENVLRFPYPAITNWGTKLSRGATLVTRTGVVAVAAGPELVASARRVPPDLLEPLRAVVEARLPATTIRG